MVHHLRKKEIKNATIILIIIAIVAILVGYFIGLSKSKSDQKKDLQQVFSFPVGVPLSGTIKSISPDKNSITVDVATVMGVSIPADYQSKTVLVDNNTKIISNTKKSPEQFSKEMAEAKAKAKNIFSFTPPSPFSQQSITINDLKPDETVTFSYDQSNGKSVLDPEFKAIEINVNQLF